MLANLITKYDNFKRRKLKICPNPPKIIMISYFSFPKYGDFSKNFKRVPLSMLLGMSFFNKEFSQQKNSLFIIQSAIIIKLTENNANVVSWFSRILHLYLIKLCQISGTNSWG
jgi:hypothetical protein